MVLSVYFEGKNVLEIASSLKFLQKSSEFLSFGPFSFQSILILDGALAVFFIQAPSYFGVRINQDFIDCDAE